MVKAMPWLWGRGILEHWIRWSNISSGDNCSCDQISDNKVRVYCIRHIFCEGFISASRVLLAKLTMRGKNIYLRFRRMNATCIHSARARCMILLVLYWLLRSLLSSIANLTTRENVLKFWFAKKLESRNIMAYTVIGFCGSRLGKE